MTSFPDEAVFVCNFGHGDTWLAGIISKTQTYAVKFSVHCHVDHIHPHSVDSHIQPTDSDNNLDNVISILASSDNVVPPETLVSLSTLVLNSRDRYEKNGNQILRTSKHTLQIAILE